ncbi:MAG: SHOCT domain-containing protein [Candidatus Promineofilum sp.]|nr:SHOCT domain-containing protein [Promineifilum sp.]
MRRRRGPGLVGTMARTAVIAGTATAVSQNVSSSMHATAQAKADQQQAQMDAAAQQAVAQQQAMMAQPLAPAAAPAGGDMLTKLTELVKMKEAGFLTDAEFSAAKAKLLS